MKRRDFLQNAALLGGSALLTTAVPKAYSTLQAAAGSEKGSDYSPLTSAENILYSACLGCHTTCGIKVKLLDGVVVKIDGSPYSTHNMLPHVPYDTNPRDVARLDGKLCPKGQAGIETLYDPYRLRRVLKRAGKRGENKWMTIPFDQAISEIVNGGKLFAHVQGEENRNVEGLKDIWVLRDPKAAAEMASDAKLIAEKKMSVAEFKEKHKDRLQFLIDPDHPDLGPKNNQFLFLAGRIQYGREAFSMRWLQQGFGSTNWYNHCTICGVSHRCAHGATSLNYLEKGKWATGGQPCYYQPDFANSEFLIFFGANPYEANYGPTVFAERITAGLTSGRLKIAVVDPRNTKTAARAWKWIPVKPGEDAALIMGMIRWIIENKRYDSRFLSNANKAAAKADGEPSWINASWLVKVDNEGPEKFLRGSDVDMGDIDTFFTTQGGKPVPFKVNDDKNPVEGDLFFDGEIKGVRVKSVLQILWEEASRHTLAEWADIAGIKVEDIVDLAREFTSHGKKAAAESHRGAIAGTNAIYTVLGVIALNMLIGNIDWKGGYIKGGGYWHEKGDIPGQPFPVNGSLHPGKLTPFGINFTRNGSWTWFYENSTIFEGYPAKRPWYPFQTLGGQYHEVLPSAGMGYPYKLKALWIHMGAPASSIPGAQAQLDVLADPNKIPLVIADDIVVSETALYSDYVFPDLTYLEKWDPTHPPATQVPQEISPVRQPVVAPVPEAVKVFGEEVPCSMEAVMLAIAEKLGLPGYGPDGFGSGMPFKRPEDYYLKMVANVAAGYKLEDAVPDASDNESQLFQTARRHLPPTVYDFNKWKVAVGEKWWRKVIYVLNRGGRFEEWEHGWKGEKAAHPWGGLVNMYIEPFMYARDSMTGKRYRAIASYAPRLASTGELIKDEGYPLTLITYKEVTRTNFRNPHHYWSNISIPENRILMNRDDLIRFGLRNGDLVKIVSASNPDGVWDVKGGRRIPVVGKIEGIEGLRPGVVAVAASFGHWAYGAADTVIDGLAIPGDPRRGTGLNPNVVLRLDPHLKDVCSADTAGGNVCYLTDVKLVKV
ncbi:MAG: molybdopterin-dependent oxidoreductase [Firmicutes bacterium]|nr:molybdopterin-dependent oxidoreductase [Bacillota bacterium]